MNAQPESTHAVDVEVERVIAAARDALSDEMVGRLASSASSTMELLDQVNRAGLGRAIPALTELVNNGDLDRLAKLARVYGASEDALTDEMIGRLTQAAGDGLALMDQVNRAGLDRAIPAIAEMVNNGDLDRLVKLARVYGSAEDALTDEMVGRLTDTLGNGLSLLDRFSRGGAEAHRQDARKPARQRRAGADCDDVAEAGEPARDGAGDARVDRRCGEGKPRCAGFTRWLRRPVEHAARPGSAGHAALHADRRQATAQGSWQARLTGGGRACRCCRCSAR